ncbi:hypothetical protein CGCSCA4_v004399 [Colletotrichum siamense]|uniref:CCHC-type domain-containing protein n=1 Tax=Colletotrichum siamense TaxID=690259 RepID=A0A9P5ETY1_COLSI|nr:hypothetical protein CGCSCA4_v004399 [Colletotrichum siamense]KAF4859589.1 hypothetical protein CGCSCA2_v006233 [Colletotrichum siamense]
MEGVEPGLTQDADTTATGPQPDHLETCVAEANDETGHDSAAPGEVMLDEVKPNDESKAAVVHDNHDMKDVACFYVDAQRGSDTDDSFASCNDTHVFGDDATEFHSNDDPWAQWDNDPLRASPDDRIDRLCDEDLWESFVDFASSSRQPRPQSDMPQRPKKPHTKPDISHRRSSPPWGDMLFMDETEQKKHETHGVESWFPDQPTEHIACGNCGHLGHLLADCAFPGRYGFLGGCPVCNTKRHNADDCLRVRNLSPEDLAWFVIIRRGNKPPLRRRDPWVVVLREALLAGIPVEGPLPWTIEFTQDMMNGSEDGQVWLRHRYFVGDHKILPADSMTGSDVHGAAANDALLMQRHRPNRDLLK